jgi:hypothetical protein
MEMESIEKTIKTRKWDKNLENFFGAKPLLENKAVSKNTCFDDFVDEVQAVQGLLADVLMKTKKDTVLSEESSRTTEDDLAK